MSTLDKINQLKQEREAVILAHYYVNDEVQAIADYVGDSFYLSKIATSVEAKTIVFAACRLWEKAPRSSIRKKR